jgi:predicted permease
MSLVSRIVTHFHRSANLFRRSHLNREIDEELRAHIEMCTEDNLRAGMSPEAAQRDALLRFGNRTVIRELTTAADAALIFERFGADIRYAFRQLRKFPLFAITAILTLALGIGATTAIFSVMNAVLLRSLPLPNPRQLFYLHLPNGKPDGAANTGDDETSFSLPAFEALRQDQRAFADVMAFVPLSNDRVAVRVGEEQPEQASGEMVSGNFFTGLGAPVALGRAFAMADETTHAAVAVLSDRYWTRRFARNPAALGQTIYVKGVPFTIIGIAGKGFTGVDSGQFTDFWIPLQRRPELIPWGTAPSSTVKNVDGTLYGSPNWWCLRLIARLAPGVKPQQAIAEATPEFQAAAYASLNAPAGERLKRTLALVPARGIQGLDDSYNQPVSILMGLVLLVLLIACSNVAMLIIARNAARQRDFNLRMALGAQRSTLLRQLLTESTFLVLAGALLGWLFALGATRALAAWSQLDVNLVPDRTVLLFTAAVSILAALVFGLAPMRSATNAPLSVALRASVSTSYQTRRGGTAVLACQIALCFTLLTTASLLLRTLLNYERTNLGMRTEGLLVFGVTPQRLATSDARFAFYSTLLDRMRALPGVESATFMENRLGSGWSSNDEPIVDGLTHPFTQVPLRENSVGPGYLHTLGIPLLEGRDILDSDTRASRRVAVVNETFVKKLLPNTDPIGHQLGDPKGHPYTIIGVAKDSKYRSVDEKPRAMAYYPYTQADEGAPPTLQVELRTAGDPLALLPSVERIIHQMDTNLPLEKPMTQAAVFTDSYTQQRLFSRLALFFGLLAALLVAIGLYGALAYRVNRRTTEIGVRMALGARRPQVLGMVLRESLRVAAIGIAIGLPLALLTAHFMSSMLYGLEPSDTLTLFTAFAGVVAISLTAGYLPARRAASIDPIQALRNE